MTPVSDRTKPCTCHWQGIYCSRPFGHDGMHMAGTPFYYIWSRDGSVFSAPPKHEFDQHWAMAESWQTGRTQ